jgi:hypothetical protein
MTQKEYDDLQDVAIDRKLSMSWIAREAINKIVKIHKFARKEGE